MSNKEAICRYKYYTNCLITQDFLLNYAEKNGFERAWAKNEFQIICNTIPCGLSFTNFLKTSNINNKFKFNFKIITEFAKNSEIDNDTTCIIISSVEEFIKLINHAK